MSFEPKPEVIGTAVLGIAACALVARALLASPFATSGEGDALIQSGNFLPVSKEVEAFNLTLVEGSIPASMDGIFIRNGPNPTNNRPGFHWFEGWGMLHAVRINNGIASYQNKYVQTDKLQLEKKYGPDFFFPVFSLKGFSGLASLMWQKFRSTYLGLPDRFKKATANTALAFHAGRFFALMEGDQPHLVEAQSLTTMSRFTFGGELTHSFTAHPKVDPKTGEMFFFGYSVHQQPWLNYSIIDATGKKLPSIPIETAGPRMVHDFTITEHYAIFLDMPLVFNKKNLFTDKGFFEFQKEGVCRFGVLPRYDKDTSRMKWFDVDPSYIFHVANSWEEGNEIFMVACKYDQVDIYSLKTVLAYLTLYRMNLETGEVTETVLESKFGSEFPTINEDYLGYKNRYMYSVHMTGFNSMSGIAKYDMETGKSITYIMDENDLSGEFVFVPNQDKEASEREEDDGYLVGYQYISKRNNSELVILRAQDLSVQARIVLPQRVPQGFHGRWISKEMIISQKSGDI
eukprot:TRINITY_DN3165_c0_g1_i1.p1 TRINITY_DN3165_c0_g1~~TRINITY_DN3165_c0_g1_i1.p1  ORF type:complete len:515 (-),score=122.54 TRINITY_DN3165_c0_g1_i1:141-1685(-)